MEAVESEDVLEVEMVLRIPAHPDPSASGFADPMSPDFNGDKDTIACRCSKSGLGSGALAL